MYYVGLLLIGFLICVVPILAFAAGMYWLVRMLMKPGGNRAGQTEQQASPTREALTKPELTKPELETSADWAQMARWVGGVESGNEKAQLSEMIALVERASRETPAHVHIQDCIRMGCRWISRDRRAEAEQALVKWRQHEDAQVAYHARRGLAERYLAGICHEDPGPALTAEEQKSLNWKIYCMERSRQLVSFVRGDGMEQLLTSRQRNEWEESIEGMELVGAVKRASACREVLRIFARAMKPGMKEEKSYEIVQEILAKDESVYELADGIADESEWGLDDAYVIRNRTLFLRNRGDTSWKGLLVGLQ